MKSSRRYGNFSAKEVFDALQKLPRYRTHPLPCERTMRDILNRPVRRLIIDLENGPHNSGSRTQFLKRMVEFADWSALEIRLVYHPPYHSKYNPHRALLVGVGVEVGRHIVE